jgi:hypothetical protein
VTVGDAVVYTADKLLYGVGIFIESTRDGLMVVEFADGTREKFLPSELDLHRVVARA